MSAGSPAAVHQRHGQPSRGHDVGQLGSPSASRSVDEVGAGGATKQPPGRAAIVSVVIPCLNEEEPIAAWSRKCWRRASAR